MACTIHANSAADALEALVNAALMAGENIPERVVRKVFSSSLDLVVHLDRAAEAEGIVRETMEIRAVVPALHDDFSTESLFSRSRLGAPMEWTGALPPGPLAERLQRVAPGGSAISDVMKQGILEW